MPLNFLTPVSFGNQPKSCTQSLLEKVDHFFYLGGRKACVIPGQALQEEVILTKHSPSFLTTALKVLLYCTIAIPVLLFVIKAILRATHTFRIMDVEQKLGQGIDIPEEIRAKLQELLPNILDGQENPQIQWLTRGNAYIFKLASAPNLVFKTSRPRVDIARHGELFSERQISEKRFADIMKAEETCLLHQLTVFRIPRTKQFSVNNIHFVAEEHLNLEQHAPNQIAQAFMNPNNKELIQQTVKFVDESGLFKWDLQATSDRQRQGFPNFGMPIYWEGFGATTISERGLNQIALHALYPRGHLPMVVHR